MEELIREESLILWGRGLSRKGFGDERSVLSPSKSVKRMVGGGGVLAGISAKELNRLACWLESFVFDEKPTVTSLFLLRMKENR